jgi:hypothetical protein
VLADRLSKVSALAFFSRTLLVPTYPLRPIKTNNARTLCIAAAAGTELGRCFLPQVLSLSPPAERVLQSAPSSSPSRIVAGSSFRSLPKIPHCCPHMELGPCLSPDVAIRSPKLAKDYRLGWPLPNQLPKPPAAHLQAINLSLSPFSRKFIPDFIPDLEAGSTVLLTRSPLPFGRSTRMCQARFQRSFGARITPKRFSEQNLDSIFFLILVLVERDCSPLEEF